MGGTRIPVKLPCSEYWSISIDILSLRSQSDCEKVLPIGNQIQIRVRSYLLYDCFKKSFTYIDFFPDSHIHKNIIQSTI